MVLVKEPSFAAFLFAMLHLQQSTGLKFRFDPRRARVEPMRCDFTQRPRLSITDIRLVVFGEAVQKECPEPPPN
jgi:hypothetical protein